MYFKTYNVCLEKCLVLQPCFLTQPENERKKKLNYYSSAKKFLSPATFRRKFQIMVDFIKVQLIV